MAGIQRGQSGVLEDTSHFVELAGVEVAVYRHHQIGQFVVTLPAEWHWPASCGLTVWLSACQGLKARKGAGQVGSAPQRTASIDGQALPGNPGGFGAGEKTNH